MIDINELRRLTQAATPGPWIAAGPSFGESLPKHLNEVVVDREGDEDDGYSICNAPIGLNEERSDDMAFIAEANPLAIEELLDRLEAAEKSRDDLLACLGEWLDKTKWVQQGSNEGTISAKYLGLHRADVMSSLLGEAEKERDELRDKIEAMERQEPVAEIGQQYTLLFVGSGSMTELVKRHGIKIGTKLYLAPGAQPAQKAVAYLDLGAGGYMDIGTDLNDEQLASLPKGRHMLGIVGTYGVDGYVPAQPAPSVPTALLVAVADLVAQMEIVSRVGFVDTPDDKDSCAAFCVAEGTWLELMSAVESLASALAAAPEAKP